MRIVTIVVHCISLACPVIAQAVDWKCTDAGKERLPGNLTVFGK